MTRLTGARDSNTRRAQLGRIALNAFAAVAQGDDDLETDVTDLIADLLHLLAEHGKRPGPDSPARRGAFRGRTHGGAA